MHSSKRIMGEEVVLITGSKFETAENLIRHRNTRAPTCKRGPKKTVRDGSAEEQKEIERAQNELRLLLSRPRVERLSARSVAEWDHERRVVRLVRKEGKFQGFGHTVNGATYLENYEALFLLEMNRLEIYFNSVLVSVEQAYHILLGLERSHEYDKYFIYSLLTRTGYIVRKFENKVHDRSTTSVRACTDVDCIWQILRTKLDSSHKIPAHAKNHEQFDKLEKSMESIVEKTKNAFGQNWETSQMKDEAELQPNQFRKRKSKRTELDYKHAKKRKLYNASARYHGSFVDVLKDEENYQRFQEIFAKFEVVGLKASDDYDEENCRNLTIDFDLYLPDGKFKQTGNMAPVLRAVVLGFEDNLPSRSELVKLFRTQLAPIPLLIVSSSLSKHVQSFLYYFS